ncbi:unknown protein [Microcystis aeruginosa NIES-843]|uniref:Uncharacterized protein n=1 Tax=Microcystis aeruginosa (strain NIES-843 / IAM M-2473) TaxID=449447 RepID=B0JRZ4_MICAN|nr:unknown protein [Microcystis aeruginosa NIES-843]
MILVYPSISTRKKKWKKKRKKSSATSGEFIRVCLRLITGRLPRFWTVHISLFRSC